ncbi:MAG: CDP-alcohol phosphatidyltransferase family protein [Actinomycetes bacterium]
MAGMRVATVPNALSALRLAGVPVFCWLVVGPHADVAAFFVLAAGAITDWLDGKLARVLNQYSRLGELLDPLVDRLYILATLAVLSARDIVPWELAVFIVARDVLLTVVLAALRRHGYGPLPVHVLGKAATMCMLYAFPLLLLGAGAGWGPTVARSVGWAFAIWGTALYWWAGVLYAVQAQRLIEDDKNAGGERQHVSLAEPVSQPADLTSSG